MIGVWLSRTYVHPEQIRETMAETLKEFLPGKRKSLDKPESITILDQVAHIPCAQDYVD